MVERVNADSAKASTKWKSKLLSSSLPLEFEVARIINAVGFSVYADYSYHRSFEGHDVEWSVDIRGIRETTGVHGAKRGCAFDLLVECKFRQRHAGWFFLPAMSRDAWTSEYDVIRGVDEFTRWFLLDREWLTRPFGVPITYKAAEIDFTSGHVEAAEIRHAISQLQFAIPPLLRTRIELLSTSYEVIDNTPFFFAPVLVTNAPLFVARDDLTTRNVEAADDPRDLAHEVPCLIIRVEAGQDLFTHARRHLAGLGDVVSRKGILRAEEHRREQGVLAAQLPSILAKRLKNSGEDLEAVTNVKNIIVCNIAHLRELVNSLVEITDRVATSATLEQPDAFKFS